MPFGVHAGPFVCDSALRFALLQVGVSGCSIVFGVGFEDVCQVIRMLPGHFSSTGAILWAVIHTNICA